MTNSHPALSTHSTGTPVPPPSSLCPVCGHVEADAKHYQRGQIDEVLYVCWAEHSWLVRWTAPKAVT